MNSIAIMALALMLLAGCATAKKTNAQKCKDMGGSYNAATRTCQLQSE